MQQQHGALRQRQLIQQIHKFSFRFAPDEQIVRAVFKFIRRFWNFIEQNFFAAASAPKLNDFLMRDAKEPASKFSILPQTADVSDSGDKSLLHDVETRLFV